MARIVRRSFLFVYFPTVLLAMLGANLVWEIVRQNSSPAVKQHWPLRFTILDTSTTAALLGVMTGLLLARLQWARANRPTLSYVISDEKGTFDAASNKWIVWLHNGGPGMAVVTQFQYVVGFTNAPTSTHTTLNEINRVMNSRDLVSGVDYFVREMGPGAALPASTARDAPLICWFNIRTLAQLTQFDVLVQVRDGLGDTHERTIVVFGKLPDIALRARQEHLDAAAKRSQRGDAAPLPGG
ncbi:hypothetical protein ACQP00_45310 [Dactylosporangium sp. CS-047395]|uniref:hypothetical protein n=1 Tax=Dactylosporangium sp. CS-047395 TaxID=3239936 RepID=UPI003D9440E5